MPYTFGVIFDAPDPQEKEVDADYNPDPEIYILFVLPIALAAIQSFLMISVFRYDTPPDPSNASTRVMASIYLFWRNTAVDACCCVLSLFFG